ncbi:hypothetical protein [Scytonema sp. PCC 10023]|uniref:hypothetical protein n=1 Tax=Scytonema sp. PCC 10023 TaxID=1680591 RepID=UPI0039C636F7
MSNQVFPEPDSQWRNIKKGTIYKVWMVATDVDSGARDCPFAQRVLLDSGQCGTQSPVCAKRRHSRRAACPFGLRAVRDAIARSRSVSFWTQGSAGRDRHL